MFIVEKKSLAAGGCSEFVTGQMRSARGGGVLLGALLLLGRALADTTVHHDYWERLQDSLWGFLAGCCLFLFSVCALVGTEKQAIVYEVLLDRCQQATVIINNNCEVNALNENHPVFVSGEVRLRDPSEHSDHSGGEVLAQKGRGDVSNVLDPATGYRCSTRNLAIRLRRRVEMFQWVEHTEEREKETKYTYSLEWREKDVASSHFQESYTHHNPSRSPALYSTSIDHPSPSMIGAYTLAKEQIDMMHNYYTCPIPANSLERDNSHAPQYHLEQGVVSGFAKPEPASSSSFQQQDTSSWWGKHNTDFLVYNGSLMHPQPGTVRISYEALTECGEVSLVAVQMQRSLQRFRPFSAADAQAMEPWFVGYIYNVLSGDCSCRRRSLHFDPDSRYSSRTNSGSVCCLPCKICCCCCYTLSSCATMFSQAIVGDSVFLVEERRTTLGDLFNSERNKLGMRLLLMRIGGCLLLSLSIYLIFNPIAVILSFIPYLSGLLSKAFWIVSLLIGFILGALLIALSWVLYRPLYFGGNCILSICKRC